MALPADFDWDAFLNTVDQDSNLRGSRVVFFDGYQMTVVREGPPYCAEGLQAIVVRIAIEQTALQSAPAAQARDGRILGELLGLGLGCSAAALSWLVVVGSAGAAPITGGTSTFITYLSLGAATASTIQCVNAAARTYEVFRSPETLDVWDQTGWYVKTSYVLDTIAIAGAISSTATTIKVALALRRTTGKTMIEVLKGLSRQQRKQLAEEAVRIQNPGISNGQLKVLVRAGVYPQRFTGTAISNGVKNQLKDALGAALGFTGSALTGVVREGAKYVAGMAQSIETYQ
jgi:hypothetical protein